MHKFEDAAAAYVQSKKFQSLAANTQRIYTDGMVVLFNHFETVPLTEITRPMVIDIRDRYYDSPGKCKIALSTLNNVMGFAYDKGWVKENVAAAIRDLPPSTGYKRWTLEEVETFLLTAYPHLRDIVILALYTGQRRGDLAKMKWSDYDGRTIYVKQQKTGKELHIPVHPRLAEHLAARKETQVTALDDPHILLTRRGLPWVPRQMSEAVTDYCVTLGIRDRALHGLRKTTASILAEMGCTPLQIMAITGHASLKEVERYTLEAEQKRLAADAMGKWRD